LFDFCFTSYNDVVALIEKAMPGMELPQRILRIDFEASMIFAARSLGIKLEFCQFHRNQVKIKKVEKTRY
jgi:hypothetical protein